MLLSRDTAARMGIGDVSSPQGDGSHVENSMERPFENPLESAHLLCRLGMMLDALGIGLFHRVLDFGGGNGWVSRFLNRMGCRAVCLDLSEPAIERAQKQFELDPCRQVDLPVEFLTYHGHRFPLETRSVDRVVSFDAFNYVTNPGEILHEMARVLTDGGKAGFFEPAGEHSMSVAEMKSRGMIHRGIVFEEFVEMAKWAGFTDVKVHFAIPPAEQVAMSVEQRAQIVNGDASAFPLEALSSHLKSSIVVILGKGTAPTDSRRPRVLRGNLRVLDSGNAVSRSGAYRTLVEVRNTGDTIWIAQTNVVGGYVTVGAQLMDSAGKMININHARGLLPRDLAPGEAAMVEIHQFAPEQPGNYELALAMCCERIGWFTSELNGPPFTRLGLRVS
jgi:SAM-dependent methyltransferase